MESFRSLISVGTPCGSLEHSPSLPAHGPGRNVYRPVADLFGQNLSTTYNGDNAVPGGALREMRAHGAAALEVMQPCPYLLGEMIREHRSNQARWHSSPRGLGGMVHGAPPHSTARRGCDAPPGTSRTRTRGLAFRAGERPGGRNRSSSPHVKGPATHTKRLRRVSPRCCAPVGLEPRGWEHEPRPCDTVSLPSERMEPHAGGPQ